MKNKLSKVILSTLLVASSLMAGSSSSFFGDTHSLVGFEGGYTSLDVDKYDGSATDASRYNMYNGGIKIGAQSEDYRFFLSARYYSASDFDYATTFGAELQYLFNVAPYMNLFIGAGTGIVNMRYLPDAPGSVTRTISDPYFSGDFGTNIHLGEEMDLELGARILALNASNTISGVKYTFDNMITAYVSIIFKFKMD